MTAPMRRPVAYEVAVGRHVPQPDMAFAEEAEWSSVGRSPRWNLLALCLALLPVGLLVWWLGYVAGKALTMAALAALQAGG